MASRKPHKYYKMSMQGDKVWACAGCARANCTHYMPKHLEQLVIDRPSICWSCGETFVLDALAMTRDKPVCMDCNPQMTALLSAVIDKLT